MSDIAELERRITAALERIGRGIERGPGPAQPPAPGSVVPGADLAALIAERDAARAEAQAKMATMSHSQNVTGRCAGEKGVIA